MSSGSRLSVIESDVIRHQIIPGQNSINLRAREDNQQIMKLSSEVYERDDQSEKVMRIFSLYS